MSPLPTEDLNGISAQTAALWDEARGQRIFLTGGTGFLGCWLVESFLHANRLFHLDAHLTVLTRSPEAFLGKCPWLRNIPALSLIPGDVRDFPFPDGDFPYVIHAATEATVTLAEQQPLTMHSVVVDGTRRVLDFAAARQTRKFLLTSSGAIYGKQPPNLTHVPETYLGAPDHLSPAGVYAEGKRMAEHLCALYSQVHGFDCKIARCWAFAGPHLPLHLHFAIGNFIRDALSGQPIRIAGDGTPTRSYLYASDLAAWLWTMLFQAPSMFPINVGSGEAVSIRQLAETVVSVLRPGARIEIARQPVAGAPFSQYVPDVHRAQSQLGLSVTVPLEQAIQKTATWHGWRSSSASK